MVDFCIDHSGDKACDVVEETVPGPKTNCPVALSRVPEDEPGLEGRRMTRHPKRVTPDFAWFQCGVTWTTNGGDEDLRGLPGQAGDPRLE